MNGLVADEGVSTKLEFAEGENPGLDASHPSPHHPSGEACDFPWLLPTLWDPEVQTGPCSPTVLLALMTLHCDKVEVLFQLII